MAIRNLQIPIPDGSLVFAQSYRGESFFPDGLAPAHIPETAIVGRKTSIDLIPDYPVTMIEDLNGRLHFFEEERTFVSPIQRNLSPKEIEVAKKAAHSHVAEIDAQRVFRFWCEQDKFHKSQPYYRDLKRLVDRSVVKGKDVSYYLAGCLGGTIFTVSLKDFQSKWRQVPKRDESWWAQHGSNFTEGIALMTVAHNCLSVNPVMRNRALVGVLGANVVGNTWEEIDIPGIPQKSLPTFISAGQEVKTDRKDFESGMLGTLTYLVLAKAFDRTMIRAMLGSCPK